MHTLDVSKHGVMLGGLRCELNVGDKIEVHHHHKRAQFRVVWVKTREGSKEKQLGAECMEPEKQFWDMESQSGPTSTPKKNNPLAGENHFPLPGHRYLSLPFVTRNCEPSHGGSIAPAIR